MFLCGHNPPWEGCCVTHDLRYWRGGTARDRLKADRELRRCVAANGHPVWGALMYAAVRIFGHPAFCTPWRWGYGTPGKCEYDA